MGFVPRRCCVGFDMRYAQQLFQPVKRLQAHERRHGGRSQPVTEALVAG
jgi:hypothetical protein